MKNIITITNQKGGVGKTTTAHALATGLTIKGYKTLIVDMDPQANVSYTMGIDEAENTIYDVLKGQVSSLDAIQKTEHGDILPSTLLLAGADMEFTSTGREYLLRDALEPLKDSYDYIIIDTPPQLGILTVNSLVASDNIIITMGADIYSLKGLTQLYSTYMSVKKYCNHELSISGLLLTRYNNRTIINKDLREVMKDHAKQLGTKLFDTAIREGIAIREAQALQTTIYDHAPKSNPAKDYLSFIEEYLQSIN